MYVCETERMDHDAELSFPDAPRAELDRVLAELVDVAQGVLTTQGRLRALLRANQAVVQQLELPVVLKRIVDVAVELVDAKYGALGVIAPQGGLEQFIYVGMTPRDEEIIGHLPEGHGLLGAVIDDPRPIRLRHITDDPRSSGFPDGHPPMDSFLGVPVRVRDKVFGNLYLTEQRSGQFSADDEQLVTALAETAGFAIENARLFADTRRRQAWTTASAEITAALLSSEDSNPIELLVSRVLTLSAAHLVCVVLPTDDPAEMFVSAAKGEGEDQLLNLRFPLAGSAAASVIESRQPRILENDSVKRTLPTGDKSLGPTMAVPLIASGRILGVMIVSRRPGSTPFIDPDLEVAADFAGRATVAMELASARADRQRMVLMADRGRIARDLHDHVIQQLFATGLELQSVASAISPAHAAKAVTASVAQIDAAIAQIRTAIFALGSGTSDRHDTIRHRIIDVVNELGSALPHTPRLDFSGPVDLVMTEALAHDVIAVTREALTNVAKHAAASTASVSLTAGGGTVDLEVVDDGIGVTAPHRRSGLANLETRATARSGSCTLVSEPGRTVLTWSVPIPDDEEDDN
jgi:signal transduction histidine kinase